MKRCLIFCAAECHGLLEPVGSEDHVIAADGGLEHTQRLGIHAHEILGDFDSLGYIPEDSRVFPVEKDDTDAMLAVRRGLQLGFRELCRTLRAAFASWCYSLPWPWTSEFCRYCRRSRGCCLQGCRFQGRHLQGWRFQRRYLQGCRSQSFRRLGLRSYPYCWEYAQRKNSLQSPGRTHTLCGIHLCLYCIRF